MRSLACLCVAWGLFAVACSSNPASEDDSDDSAVSAANPTARLSYVGAAVHDALASSLPQEKGSTWDESFDNKLANDWLLEVPLAKYWGATDVPTAAECDEKDQNCNRDFAHVTCNTQADCAESGGTCTELAASVAHEGAAPTKLCLGHSDTLVDSLYAQMLSAKSTLDITSLSPPDVRFRGALRNAITRLSERPNPPRVRMLFGFYPGPGQSESAEVILQSLTRDVAPTSKLEISVVHQQVNITSWNHSKIIAADGASAIVGGMNMWTKDYLQAMPVHDLSIHVSGGAAASAQKFVNRLWKFSCEGHGFLHDIATRSAAGETSTACPAEFVAAASSNAAGIPIISVSRLGKMNDDVQTGDIAFPAMIDAAKTTVHIAQQDLGPPNEIGVTLAPWPAATLAAIGRAVARGVDVTIVVSNPGKKGGYGHGWTVADVAEQIAKAVDEPTGAKLRQNACTKLHIAGARGGAAENWDKGEGYALHTKMIMIDDRTVYVGSQNIYTANLQEFGYIYDDPATAKAILDQYYAKLWGFSSVAAGDGGLCGGAPPGSTK